MYIGTDFSGILDSEVMQIAMDQKRTILTFDRDYGELIFKKGFKPEMGVIYAGMIFSLKCQAIICGIYFQRGKLILPKN